MAALIAGKPRLNIRIFKYRTQRQMTRVGRAAAETTNLDLKKIEDFRGGYDKYIHTIMIDTCS